MRISVGVIAVPESSAQAVADLLVKGGVRVILNYAPAMIRVPSHIKVHETDPAKELLHTLYYLTIRARSMKKS
jgi:redox-sensing transcriptional repressor